MLRLFYRLDSPEGQGQEDYVDAKNKTEARQIIAQAYRQDTPRAAARSGFIPFGKCTIVWLREEELGSSTLDDDYFEESGDLKEEDQGSQPPLAISDPRIGLLIREGKPVYYAYLKGDYENGYFEGSLKAVEDALAP